MNTYKITFEITSKYHPAKWDWYDLLKTEEGEEFTILDIEEVDE